MTLGLFLYHHSKWTLSDAPLNVQPLISLYKFTAAIFLDRLEILRRQFERISCFIADAFSNFLDVSKMSTLN